MGDCYQTLQEKHRLHALTEPSPIFVVIFVSNILRFLILYQKMSHIFLITDKKVCQKVLAWEDSSKKVTSYHK